ncbi:hypothetical protein OZ666_13260 [Elizabethkingia sp. HX QKY]|uniref:hypothetical protein n=1 Tax=Elizabethkingia TaxID=308865 RepID=UPI002A24E71E|nr:hypothetical protein [Elizabethkingia sp. HX QKY]MDX8572654.1 hypothetical protein [Elizabethkingia sp. HX QKY]
MKTSFQLEINKAAKKMFFPEERIKSKFQIIEILLEACRYILYNKREKEIKSEYKVILHIDKMNRIFFVSKTKMYSITFPFSVNIDSHTDHVTLDYKEIMEINSLTISNLLEIIKSSYLSSHNCLEFIEPIIFYEDNQKINYWNVLRDLLLLEDGYLRYDYDEKGFQDAREKGKEHKHPLNHLDIFYTNQATFKVGLENQYLYEDFRNILDLEEDCKYLNAPPRKKVKIV